MKVEGEIDLGERSGKWKLIVLNQSYALLLKIALLLCSILILVNEKTCRFYLSCRRKVHYNLYW